MNKSLRAKVALAELEAMGLTVDDLLSAAGADRTSGSTTPTVAEYVPIVAAGYSPEPGGPTTRTGACSSSSSAISPSTS